MYSLIFPILLFFAEGLFGFETDGVKSLSVIEGDSVTLPTCIQRQNYKKILWMFEKSLIAKIKEQELSTEDGPDGIFRDRLKLDFESGSLTIKNIRTSHSGLYQVGLISTIETTKIFNVTVIGVFDPDAYKIKSVSVMEGESVTLNTDVELQKDDLMLWKFAKVTKDYVYDPVHHNPCQSDATIVKIYGENLKISLDDGESQIFNNVLKVDKLSGSLTITSVTPAHSGFYILQRTNNTGTKCRRFRVTVSDTTKSHSDVVWMSVALVFIVLFMVTFVCLAVATKIRNALLWRVRSSKRSQETESKSMMEGQSLILDTKRTELTTDDVIEWRYKGSVIARIGKTSQKMYNGADGQFRDRLELDTTTGSLTITNTTNKDAGDYQLLIVKNEKVESNRKFNVFCVFVAGEVKSVFAMVGDSVTLRTDLTEIKDFEELQWKIQGESSIMAGIDKENDVISVPGNNEERFRDRLKLDHQTGFLTITNIKTSDSRVYELSIKNSKTEAKDTFSVTVREVNRLNGAENIHQNEQTRDITFRNIRRDQSGVYTLQITTNSVILHRKFRINISDVFSDEKDGVKTVSVRMEESVRLHTHISVIQQNDPIEWTFGPQNIPVAKTDGKSTSISYNYNDVRFKNRLYLDVRTGDLTINKSSTEHSGLYQLKIITTSYTIQKSFNVAVSNSRNSGVGSGISGASVALMVWAVTVFLLQEV